MDFPPARQFKSNENSPSTATLNPLLNQHHRTKALMQNIVFNSLSQTPAKFYTVTIDENKLKEATTSKMLDKAVKSQDQKRLVIEDIETCMEDKKDFMSFKFGKKYYTSKLKNPLFSGDDSSNTNTRNENSLTLNSISEKDKTRIDDNQIRAEDIKTRSDEIKTRTDDNRTIPIIDLAKMEKEFTNSSDKVKKERIRPFDQQQFKNISERTEKTDRKLTSNKLLKYLERLKKSNVVVDLDDLQNRIYSRTPQNSLLSKSVNFHKVVSHKFNSNSILECKKGSENKNNSFVFETRLLVEFQQMKLKVRAMDKEIKELKERNAKDRYDYERNLEALESRIQRTELVLGEAVDKISMLSKKI